MIEDENDILDVVQRWESLGLLEGLPIQDRVELAQIYDNATRLLLSELTLKKVPKKNSDILDEVYVPICRRLYKRVGPNFDIENMMSELLVSVNEKKEDIITFDPNKPEKNPVVEFCVNFADNYEDSETIKKFIGEVEYTEKIENLLLKLKEILLNEQLISYVSTENEVYNLNFSKTKKTKQQIRFWNQSVAKQLINSVLSEINKGN